MTVVAIFAGSHCSEAEIARAVAAELGVRAVGQDLYAAVAASHGVSEDRLREAVDGPSSLFGSLRRDRERNVALLRLSLAELVAGDDVVIHGPAVQLVARTLPQVLRVCLAARRSFRIDAAMAAGLPEKKARRAIEQDDRRLIQWTQYLFDLAPWDERLYDQIVPMHATTVERAVELVVTSARNAVVRTTAEARRAAEDALLAARIQLAAAERGHDVDVTAADGHVTLLVKREVLRLERLEQLLREIALGLPGVRGATTRLGPRYRAQGMQRELDSAVPSRVLLVDDEKDFVHTLSERLQARDFAPAVAYDGEDALSFVDSKPPEVMVVDLKMPGVDGLEVLRRVKAQHPEVEVIILTGHGGEAEEALARDLGAFAYLHKPVDIELLSRTMREAYRAVARRQASAAVETPPASGSEPPRPSEDPTS